MTAPALFSVRMRASQKGRHLSGAERMVPEQVLVETVAKLVDRGRRKSEPADHLVVTIDLVDQAGIRRISALNMTAVHAPDAAASRALARSVLQQAGVSLAAINGAFAALDAGPSASGRVMRGAAVMDALTAERLEPDQERGIRASRFDWTDEASLQAAQELAKLGLGHFRTHEALALASKAALAPGMVAELCWSDDSDYAPGYVASSALGYIRFPHMKKQGSPAGGRVFFVDRSRWDLDAFQEYLQLTPVLIAALGVFRAVQDIDAATGG